MGLQTAKKLFSTGAEIVLVARSMDKLRTIAEEMGERTHIFSFDMQQYTNVESIFEFCKDKVGKLDGMFFSVGVCEVLPIRAVDPERAMEIIGINSMSFLQAGRFFAQKKYSNDGSGIVAISSYESSLCDKGQSIYAGSKACMEAFARVMAKEYAGRGIRVNTISPAIVDTQMLHRTQESGAYSYERIKEIQHFGVIDPASVADLAVFLLSEENKYVTGENIKMSAGWLGE